MPVRLYQLVDSPYCRKVRWLLARKGVAAGMFDVDPDDRSVVEALCGEPGVPLLVTDDTMVAGSTPIAYFLDRRWPEPSLFPEDPRKRNQAVTFNEFGDEVIGRVALALCGLSGREDAGTSPSSVGDATGLHAELVKALGQVREVLGRGALNGERIHLGDVSVAAHLVTCRSVEEIPFDEDYFDLADYVARVRRECNVEDD